jgi:hypothetical protein
MSAFWVNAEKSFDPERGQLVYALKIQTEGYELNVYLRPEEIEAVSGVRSASWDNRGSLAIGRTAGACAFWCSDAEHLSIVVGRDDENWDFSVTLPVHACEEILEELNRCQAEE